MTRHMGLELLDHSREWLTRREDSVSNDHGMIVGKKKSVNSVNCLTGGWLRDWTLDSYSKKRPAQNISSTFLMSRFLFSQVMLVISLICHSWHFQCAHTHAHTRACIFLLLFIQMVASIIWLTF